MFRDRKNNTMPEGNLIRGSDGCRRLPMVFGGPMSIVPECIFCYHNIKDRIEDEYGSVVAVRDLYPVTSGHTLVIPKRHVATYFMLTEQDVAATLAKLSREGHIRFEKVGMTVVLQTPPDWEEKR